MMKQLIEYSGSVIFIIAIAILIFGLFQETINNNILLLSGILLLLGLLVQVLVGKKFM